MEKYVMCVLVLGAGYQGAVIAETLSVNSYVYQVTVIDVDNSKLRQFEARSKESNVTVVPACGVALGS
ncbi:hypothetical protein MUP77_14495 [Candidatus Bathyarchaeota archaeon]|nr:hypothetical protein [Candidatus Bathyarchaeota archaeon]